MTIERNYFITMHHQARVHFENFTEVKFRDILLTGTEHRDRRLNRDSPGQTGTYGRSTYSPYNKKLCKANWSKSRDLYWINATFRGLRQGNFHLLSFRWQAKFLTSTKFRTYCLSVILLLRVKKKAWW